MIEGFRSGKSPSKSGEDEVLLDTVIDEKKNEVVMGSDESKVERDEGSFLKTPKQEKIKEERYGMEHVECDRDGNTSRRKRGRKRSRVGGNECDGVELKKVKKETSELNSVGRVLRPRLSSAQRRESKKERNVVENTDVGVKQSEIKTHNGGDHCDGPSVAILKRKRGRPPKTPTVLQGSNLEGKVPFDKNDVIGSGKNKRGSQSAGRVKGNTPNSNLSSKDNEFAGKQSSLKQYSFRKKTRSRNLSAEDNVTSSGKNSKVFDTCTPKKRKKNKAGLSSNAVAGEYQRSTKKQLLRDRIIDMLLKAGWTIEYRPRKSKEYNDAVYVSPEGRGYWSVTLAYTMLKKHYENDAAKTNETIFSFTPIPEEELSILLRITKKKKEREKKLKQKGDGKNKTGSGSIVKKSAKNIQAVHKHKEKSSSLNGKPLKGGVKGKPFLCERSSDTSDNGLPMRVRKNKFLRGTQSRNRCALLVRGSKNEADSELGGYIPYCGKRSVLAWLIDLAMVPLNGKVQYMNQSRSQVMLEGSIMRDGIHCGCCDEIVTISKFACHAGSKQCIPSQNIYLESGISLLQCQLDSWNKQEKSELSGFHFIDIDGDDPNDDTCGICGDGGDLICCDGCPSTFHQSCLDIQKFPSGDWHCVYCSCKFCGAVGRSAVQQDYNHDMIVSPIFTCNLCEEKYHQSCIRAKDMKSSDSNSLSFCGKICHEIFETLQMLLGVKHDLEEGFSWTLLQRSDLSSDISLSGVPQKVECNSKLAVASHVMDECFLPIVDKRSGISLIHNILYNCGSNFNRLNYTGFITAVLEKGDEIISAASIRIHGNQLAEMPFIGTRHMYRRQGMCRRLLSAIETALRVLSVKTLVIPAIAELMETWTSVFGFKPLEVSFKHEMRHMNMIVFPGTDMLQKTLTKDLSVELNLIPTAAMKSSELILEHKTMIEGVKNSEGPESIVSGEDTVHQTRGIIAEPPALEPSLPLADGSLHDTSDITSETVNFPESATDVNYPSQLGVTDDDEKSNTIVKTPGSVHDAQELNSQCANGISEYMNNTSVVTDFEEQIFHASMEGTGSVACVLERMGNSVKISLPYQEEGSVLRPSDNASDPDCQPCMNNCLIGPSERTANEVTVDVVCTAAHADSHSRDDDSILDGSLIVTDSLAQSESATQCNLSSGSGVTVLCNFDECGTCNVAEIIHVRKNQVSAARTDSNSLNEDSSFDKPQMVTNFLEQYESASGSCGACDVPEVNHYRKDQVSAAHTDSNSLDKYSHFDKPQMISNSLEQPESAHGSCGACDFPEVTHGNTELITAHIDSNSLHEDHPIEWPQIVTTSFEQSESAPGGCRTCGIPDVVHDRKDGVTAAHTDSNSPNEDSPLSRPQMNTNSLEQSKSAMQGNCESLCSLTFSSGAAVACVSSGCNTRGITEVIHDGKDGVTAAHTDSNSLDKDSSHNKPQVDSNSLEQTESVMEGNIESLCNLTSSPGTAVPCVSSRCNTCGITEVIDNWKTGVTAAQSVSNSLDEDSPLDSPQMNASVQSESATQGNCESLCCLTSGAFAIPEVIHDINDGAITDRMDSHSVGKDAPLGRPQVITFSLEQSEVRPCNF